MNLKEILNLVLTQSGFHERPQFVTSGDPDDKQMVSLANMVNREIVDFFPWPQLRRVDRITMRPGIERYAMPAGFRRYIADSAWPESGAWEVLMPTTDQEWSFLQSREDRRGRPQIRARLEGDQLVIDKPRPNEVIRLEYIDGRAVNANSTNTPREMFEEDDDTWGLSDRVLILGIKGHWMLQKEFPTAQAAMAIYRQALREEIGRVSGSRTVSFNAPRWTGAPYSDLWVSR